MDIFVDSSNTLYVADRGTYNGMIYVRQGSVAKTIPSPGQSTASCLLTGLYAAYGIAVDQSGNMYVSMGNCNGVVRWAPNANKSVLIAGTLGSSGSSNTQFNYVW